jgi:hypothetical protein
VPPAAVSFDVLPHHTRPGNLPVDSQPVAGMEIGDPKASDAQLWATKGGGTSSTALRCESTEPLRC